MVSSKAATPEAYLAELPPDWAALVARVRDLVNAHLPPGYVARMNWGMICWEVPLERYPVTYNGQPLGCAALAAQKNYTALYLGCSPERLERLKAGYAAAGKTLDMGKVCLRFRKAEDLAEEALAEAIAAVPVETLIAEYEASRRR